MRAIAMTVFASACASLAVEKGASDTGGAPADFGGDTGDTGEADGQPEPAWWSLDGLLRLADGVPVPGESTLHVEVFDTEGVGLCSLDAALAAAAAVDPLPEPELLGAYWDVEVDAWTGDCTLEAAPLAFQLGLGVAYPDVAAVVALELGDDVAAALSGAYASFDEGATIYAFGAAGSEAAWSGQGTGLASGEVPADGEWVVRAVYLFGLDAASSGSTAATSPVSGQ